jgi:hypothetical protein
LISSKPVSGPLRAFPTTLSDIWLAADDFYCVLQGWHDAFEAEWASTPKTSDADVGVG